MGWLMTTVWNGDKMLPDFEIEIYPIENDRYQWVVRDSGGGETLTDFDDSWSPYKSWLAGKERSWDRAIRAASKMLATNIENLLYKDLLKARQLGEGISIKIKGTEKS